MNIYNSNVYSNFPHGTPLFLAEHLKQKNVLLFFLFTCKFFLFKCSFSPMSGEIRKQPFEGEEQLRVLCVRGKWIIFSYSNFQTNLSQLNMCKYVEKP